MCNYYLKLKENELNKVLGGISKRNKVKRCAKEIFGSAATGAASGAVRGTFVEPGYGTLGGALMGAAGGIFSGGAMCVGDVAYHHWH
ncbi:MULTISPECIES: Blp family class II bacteriocin [Lactobacillus]|nr:MULTISPECIES: Blp family class II bacteriocin [Lactobacillus]